MFEAGLENLLKTDSALAAAIQSGPFPVLVPEIATYPCLSYQRVAGSSKYTLNSKSWQSRLMQFDAWSTNYSECQAIVLALRNLLDAYAGTLNDGTRVMGTFAENIIDNWEFDGRCYRITVEYRFQIVEA